MRLIEHETQQKLRGGFYTPAPIADFILNWSINGSEHYDILEPSSGDGIFLERIKANNYKYKSITALELDKEEARKTDSIPLPNKSVFNVDFHEFCNSSTKTFDLIIGNPPYIRYQYFNRHQQAEAANVFKRANLKYSKLTNAWVSFVIGSSLLLKGTGKIGFVVPAEILQVSYAKPLRAFLAGFYNKINIISFKKLVFPNIQQEVILLLCERNRSGSHTIEHLELDNIQGLKQIDLSLLKAPRKQLDFKSNKWTFYFLDQREIDFLEEVRNHGRVSSLGDYAEAEVGITTGANAYFTVPKSTVETFDLYDYARPLVGRSVQVNSLNFTPDDWRDNANEGARAYLLIFPTITQLEKNKKALEYLRLGEQKNIHNGYKCSIRDEWQIVPSVWVPEALFIRRNNLYPRLIVNEAGAYTTDTMHRLKLKDGVDKYALAASFFNSLSFAFSEISGRSYGGGVLELMPGEVEKVCLPYKESNAALLTEIDRLLRNNGSTDQILEFSNNHILKNGWGFTGKEIKMADRIWKKLSHRRLNRSRKK
jgi:adenine-specific DNA methylase